MALEEPDFSLVSRAGSFEIRDYERFWIAECRPQRVTGQSAALSRAFSTLFNYIQGTNLQGQAIAMTKPVRQTADETGWLVSFVIPKAVVRSGIPEPTDPSVSILEVPAGRYAVIRFRGFWSEERQREKFNELQNHLAGLGLRSVGAPISAVYNPPFTPPPLRRNEVMVAIGN